MDVKYHSTQNEVQKQIIVCTSFFCNSKKIDFKNTFFSMKSFNVKQFNYFCTSFRCIKK